MINIFYFNGIMWIGVLISYLLGWSDLCTPLNTATLLFIGIIIVASIAVGFAFRKKMKFIELDENPHKNRKATIILTIFFVLDILYARKIPIFYVLQGISYGDVGFVGIPLLHNIISSIAIFYSIYLSYIFFNFKDKKVLLENAIIVLFFILLIQRQNILICILMFCVIWLEKYLASKKDKYKIIKFIIVFVIACSAMLYLFGGVGNMRYGEWSWNDSSMICGAGQINDKYPKFLPLNYFWAYTYVISPLSNLNYNITNCEPSWDLGKYTLEYVPQFIANRVYLGERADVDLPVESLNATTAYTRAYVTFGYAGIYIMLFMQLAVCSIIVYYTYKNNKRYFVVVCNALAYFLVFSFFDNTFVYTITATMLVYSIACCINIQDKFRYFINWIGNLKQKIKKS